ncbi:helix-turn-helix transcriptional regulator [Actinoplanes sp. NPDC051633]|uniref:helix-turn-helix transcriptional regulator n=1 Tax=Actinoplanes sp. NPDC051633 TaxID=3155670 RepID=UPI003415F36B
MAERQPAPRRLDHHLMALTTTGQGTVEIDFSSHPCRPGTLLWVQPGQAVRFGGQEGFDAALVSWRGDVLDDEELVSAQSHQLTGADEDAMISEFAQLAEDLGRLREGPIAGALLRHQLAVLLLRVALLTGAEDRAPQTAEARTFARFRSALEAGHAESRRVEDYAAQLGCSVRTLTRASLAITGRTAKQVVDDRVALEARRLLACTPLSVAEVGRRLGFPEPTNFGRFFHREVGESPGAFRAAATGTRENHRIPAQRSPAD